MLYLFDLKSILTPIELIGIIAGLFVLTSFLFKGEFKIRLVNSIGALFFVIYGFFIKSIPVAGINFILLIVQIYMILKELRRVNMKLNKMIDHTKLGHGVTKTDIDKLVSEALEYDFKSVCIDPIYVKYAKEKMKDSDVLVCTVVGFPTGAHLVETKVNEARQAIIDGADEIDMVINQNALKNGEENIVLEEIKALKEVCGKRILKVIIETSNLTKDQKIRACQLAKEANADFVKTSTGFFGHGAEVEDIKLMRNTVGPKMGVKASGGVRTYGDAMKMINAGATRIGASSGINIIKQKKENKNDTNTSY